jgi:hypothetical protein
MADKKRKAHPLRVAFRWCRIVVLLVVTFAVGLILWSNIYGVPGFLERAIRNEVQRRGIQLDFRKLRLKGFRHLIARDVHFQSGPTNAPTFTAREAEFIVDYERLRSGQLELSGIRLSAGRLTLPLEESKSLVVSNINTEVNFGAGDAIQVMDFSAEALGARAQVSGEVKNPGKFHFASAGDTSTTNAWQRHLLDVVEVAEQLQFKETPELKISLQADGADIAGTWATVTLRSGEATSRWGTFDQLQMTSSIGPAASNNAVRGNFLSEISGFQSQFGMVESLRVEGETLWGQGMERLLTNSVHLQSTGMSTRWFRFSNAFATLTSWQEETNSPIRSTVHLSTGPIESSGARIGTNTFTAELIHPLPFKTPAAWLALLMSRVPPREAAQNELSGTWRIDSGAVNAGPAEIAALHLSGELRTKRGRPNSVLSLVRIETPWQLAATKIRAGEIEIGEVQAGGDWSFPNLSVTNLDAKLYGGYMKGTAGLNFTSREISARTESQFPYEKLSTLLDKPVQRWFSQFEWEKPPFVESELAARFPPWTNVWKTADVAKTLRIDGRFDGGGKFRGVPADRAESHFHFTNFTWTLPDLVITRPEGQARVQYSGNVTNGDFRWKVESSIDPAVIKPVFPREQQPALEVLKFAQPPLLRAEATGNWDDEKRLGVNASLVATNFFVKEQAFSDLSTEILITNGLIHLSNVVAHRGKEEVRAPYVQVDLPGEVMFVTNVVSTMDPYIAMSLIGEDAYKAIDPYRFAVVPTVRVNGTVPLRHFSKADLRFEVAGNEFTFWRFRMPNLVGDVHWKADHISFSNVTANFYGGKAKWSGYFIIDHSDDSANYSFSAYTTNTELKYLVADLTGQTNAPEGLLDGELMITSANSANERSWNGSGKASIRDGFLWNVPVFGIFSPVLDGIAPGLGSSRVSSGGGTFTITNSVVYTRDMQVRAQGFRLSYKGQVDLDGKLDALVEAQIFRDAWIVGKLFSIALWPVSKAFEAKVSGTVDAPKTDLRFVPKFLLAPFRALNALGDAAERNKDGAASAKP